ncbi:MAG: hypothetical protein ACI82G_001957, partial [Bradymonadia bacterium]
VGCHAFSVRPAELVAWQRSSRAGSISYERVAGA